MLTIVQKLIETDIQVIVKSPELCLNLIRTYSKLYNHGQEVKTCESALRSYHEILIKTGIMNATLSEKIKNRTLVPNWEGLIYSTIAFTHISNETIYDEQAICYLNDGVLKESNFKVLPEGYKKEEKKAVDAETKTENTDKKKKSNK